MTAPMFTEGKPRNLPSREDGQFLDYESAWDRTATNASTRTAGSATSSAFARDATLDDFDLELVQAFLERTPVRKWPVTEALCYYGLIEHAERDWRVTNAALLLFARAPAKK